MSCSKCPNQQSCRHEARLSLGLNQDKSQLIGSLDGVYIKPVPIKDAVVAAESNTSLKYNPITRQLVFDNERSVRGLGSADYVSSKEILSGANIDEIGRVSPLTEGGLASVVRDGNDLALQFSVPTPIEVNELSRGFITYVQSPNNGIHYKLISPEVGGSVDTLLIGHPNGTVEFAAPIDSPILIPTANLTSNGAFSGTPSVSSGTWRYQQMGESQVVTNTSGSRVEVSLSFRYSLQTAGSRSGVYAELINGGSDYKTTFVEGQSNQKQEGYPGGHARFTLVLTPNQRCQFRFGAWTNTSGNMTVTIGSISENAGSAVQQVQQPIITIRRLI